MSNATMSDLKLPNAMKKEEMQRIRNMSDIKYATGTSQG